MSQAASSPHSLLQRGRRAGAAEERIGAVLDQVEARVGVADGGVVVELHGRVEAPEDVAGALLVVDRRTGTGDRPCRDTRSATRPSVQRRLLAFLHASRGDDAR